MPSTVGTTTSEFGTSYNFNRRSFFANTRYWVFYHDGTNAVYCNSTDGITWSSPVSVGAANEGIDIVTYFDGTYFHYVRSKSYVLYYRRGTPNANGTVTWSAVEQTVYTGNANDYYFIPVIVVDTGGHAWIGIHHVTSGDKTPIVLKNANIDGTWANASGFPYELSSTSSYLWTIMPCALTSEKVYVIYGYNNTKFKGKLYNAGWGSEETITTYNTNDSEGGSATSYGDNVYFSYLERDAVWRIMYNQRIDGSWLPADEICSDTSAYSSICIDPVNNIVYCFWCGSGWHIDYRRRINGVWDSATTHWIDESTDHFTDSDLISSFYKSETKSTGVQTIGFVYMTKDGSPYNVRFAYLDVIPSYSVLCGDTNWIFLAGGGALENIIKKIDGSGTMLLKSTHALTNGRKIRGITQSGSYIYVTCLEDEDGVSSPRVIKITKSDWTEVVKTLDAISVDAADSVGPIAVDGTNLRIGGSVATSKAALWTIAIADFSTISASYKYTTFESNRVYEDLKSFTEVDPLTYIAIIHHNYLDFNVNTSIDARVTKDYIGAHFGNFTHTFKFCVDNSENGANAYPYLLAKDAIDDAKGLHDASKIFIGVRFTQDGASSYKLYLHEDYGGVAYESTALAIALTTFYFCKLTKSSTSLTLDVYSSQALLDASGTGDVGQKTLTLHASHSFEYLYAGDTYNDGTAKACGLDIENFAIGEVTTPGQIEVFYTDTTNIYAFTTNGMIYKITKSDLTLSTSTYLIPVGSSHIPKTGCFFYAGDKPWNDLFWVTGCTFKHVLKLRTGVLGIEKELADTDTDWTLFNCAIGSGAYLYVCSGNINEIKKIDIATMAVTSTLALSLGTIGLNGIWSS